MLLEWVQFQLHNINSYFSVRLELLGHGESKVSSVTPLRLHPDRPAALLDDSFANRQTHPGTRKVPPVQALEDTENLVVITGLDSSAVVADRESNALLGFTAITWIWSVLGPRNLTALAISSRNK